MIRAYPSSNPKRGLQNIRITNNWFENDMIPVLSDYDVRLNGDFIGGMDLMNINGAVISDNTLVNIRGYMRGARGAILCWNRSKNVTAERNLIIGCDRGVCFGSPPTSEGSPITEHMDGGIIRNNVVIDAHDVGIELGHVGRIKVYNNTVMNRLQKEGHGITQSFTLCEELDVKNNLVWNKINCPDAIVENNLSDFDASYFVDVDTGDMNLTELAVNALGKGMPLTEVTTDITGATRSATTPSLGAYEHKEGMLTEILSYDGTNVSIYANKDYTNVTILIAFYDGDKLIAVETTIANLTAKTTNSIPLPFAHTSNIKMFLWEDMDTMAPICEALTQ